jgi:chromosome segregation ATPase
MGTTAIQGRPAPAPAPDHRADLAAAISRVDALTRDLAANSAAQRETRAAIRTVRAKREEAQEAAEIQAAAKTAADVQAALAATKAAREKLESAGAEFEALQALHDRLTAESERLDSSVRYARDMVERRAAQVLASAPETLALFEEYRAAQRQVAELAQTLRAFPFGALPAVAQNWDATPLAAAAVKPDPAWTAALTGLLADAETPLPGGTADD